MADVATFNNCFGFSRGKEHISIELIMYLLPVLKLNTAPHPLVTARSLLQRHMYNIYPQRVPSEKQPAESLASRTFTAGSYALCCHKKVL